MFASRLDAARRSVEQDRRVVSPAKVTEGLVLVDRKVVHHNSDDHGSKHTGFCVDGKDGSESNDIKKSTQKTRSSSSSIMFKLSEYLFDLFDANCMADFHRMEAFELAALRSFEDSSAPYSEFAHEQHILHGQFLQLFEELLEGFLRQEHYSAEEFYEQLAQHLDDDRDHRTNDPLHPHAKTRMQKSDCFDDDSTDSQPSEPDSAHEVLAVIRNYMRFDAWAENMRRMARQQLRFQSFREQVGVAVGSDHQTPPSKYSPTNHSIAHRLTEK
jgi:hypothetical protein